MSFGTVNWIGHKGNFGRAFFTLYFNRVFVAYTYLKKIL